MGRARRSELQRPVRGSKYAPSGVAPRDGSSASLEADWGVSNALAGSFRGDTSSAGCRKIFSVASDGSGCLWARAGDTSAVSGNLTLPATGPSGSTITWETSNAGAVETDGTVHRPAYGQPDGRATLTATVTRGTVTRTRTFDITVLAEELDDAGKAQAAADAVELVHPDDVRGNLTLPTSGRHGSTLSWESGDPAVVTATGEVTRPAYGEQPVDVPLTVTATVNGATGTRSIVVRVTPLASGVEATVIDTPVRSGRGTAVSPSVLL